MTPRSRPPLEIVIGMLTLALSTTAFLLNAFALSLLALVAGAVGFGLLLGTRYGSADETQRVTRTASTTCPPPSAPKNGPSS